MLPERTFEVTTSIFRSTNKYILSSSLQRLSVPFTGVSSECQPRNSSVDTPMPTSDHPDRRDYIESIADLLVTMCSEPLSSKLTGRDNCLAELFVDAEYNVVPSSLLDLENHDWTSLISSRI